MTLFSDITKETIEILVNIDAYVRRNPDKITWSEGEELKKAALANTADALGLPTLQEVLARYS